MNRKKRIPAGILNTAKIIWIFIILGLVLMSGCNQPKVYRVGILSGLSLFAEITDGFKTRMTELGYIEGRNIEYEVQSTEFDMQAYDRILEKFIKDKVDLILVFPTEASQQAKIIADGTDIPIVFASAITEDTGLVDSIQEPGGNITGVRWPGPEIVAKGFEIGVEMTPHIKRMIVCYTKGYPIVKSQLEVVRKAASEANLTLLEIPASGPEELKIELQKIPGPFDGNFLHMIADPILVTPEGFAVASAFAASRNIPMGGAPMFEGNFQSVYALIPNSPSQGKQAAYLADKIFKGTPAGKLPVLTAEYFFILNYKQAEKLKLNITDRLLGQAVQVIR